MKQCLAAAEVVAREAGAMVKAVFDQPRSASKVTDKSVASLDLVTDTDQACEKLILSRLRADFPDYEYLGEESSSEAGGYALGDAPTWVIDPIDGTTNFVHRCPEVSVSIGLSVAKKPVVGVIYDPNRDEMFTAYAGGGAFCNGKPLRVDACTELPEAIVSTNLGYARSDDAIAHLTGTIATLMRGNLRAMRMSGSACNSITSVASGRYSAYYECGPHPWDVCAGAVLVREAGGVCFDLNGGEFSQTSRRYLVAGSEALAKKILAAVAPPMPLADLQ